MRAVVWPALNADGTPRDITVTVRILRAAVQVFVCNASDAKLTGAEADALIAAGYGERSPYTPAPEFPYRLNVTGKGVAVAENLSPGPRGRS